MIGHLRDIIGEPFDNRDRHGHRIKPGHLVKTQNGVGEVLHVEQGVPGSHTDRDGLAIAYVTNAGFWGDHRAVPCNLLEVI